MLACEPSVLLRPGREHLEQYDAALARGWSPNNLRPEAAEEERERIAADPAWLLAGFEDTEAAGPPVTMPDGSVVPRLPSIRRFIWQNGFAGVISLRWTKDGGPLPETCSGHVGYAVVPWRRREGLASQALRRICEIAPRYGLSRLEVTTDPANEASKKVIERAGGRFVKACDAPEVLGGHATLHFEIALRRAGDRP